MDPQARKLLARLLGYIQTGHFLSWNEAEAFVQWFTEQDPKFSEDMQRIRAHWSEIIQAWDEIITTMKSEFGESWKGDNDSDDKIDRWQELVKEKIDPFEAPIPFSKEDWEKLKHD